MAAADEAPYGPHRISRNGQVVIPKDVLRSAALKPGEAVYLRATDGVVELIPARELVRWVQRGQGKSP